MLPSRAFRSSLIFPVSSAAFALLRILNAGGSHPREALARTLAISAAELDECVSRLGSHGVAIEVTSAGYGLSEPIDLLDVEALTRLLHERDVPIAVALYEECDSTNARLLSLAEPHAHAVCCELQSAGRGRRGRVWRSGLGDALTFSLGWRIDQPVHALGGLSLAVAVTCAGTLEALGIDGVQVKWPNDLIRDGGKLGGILVEVARSTPTYSDVVIGVGINVRADVELRKGLDQPVADLAGVALPSRTLLLAQLMQDLTRGLQRYASHGFLDFKRDWLRLHAFQNQPVRLAMNEQESIDGMARDVADDGALIVATAAGVRHFHAGDVSLRGVA